MTTRLRELRLRRRAGEPRPARLPEERAPQSVLPSVEIPPDDPLLAFLQQADGPVDLRTLQLDSLAAEELRLAGVQLVVPLVSQGELIGLLNLGRRLSDQDYSTDDRKLLDNLAAQAAPAVRVAQLVRQQEAEAQERERMEQELRVATLIQQTLLPKQLPQL
ncbi:MAG: GAF domain-containing protein, partial [Acidimicrobiia bacterium]